MLLMPEFELGQIVATPGALEALKRNDMTGMELLSRHSKGDWGDLTLEDKAANDRALHDCSRLLSAYHLPDGEKLWVITEAVDDHGRRIATTLLLPSEY